MQTNGFTELLRKYAAHPLFLAGGILYSVIALFGAISGYSPSALLAALPIAGIWAFLIAAKKNQSYFLTGLTLFKVNTIITLVLFCIGMTFAIIGVTAFFVIAVTLRDTLGITSAELAVTFFVLISAVALLIVAVAFYFAALLNVIKSIRAGILGKDVARIKGVTPFFVTSVLASVSNAFLTLLAYVKQEQLNAIASEVLDTIREFFEAMPSYADSPEMVEVFEQSLVYEPSNMHIFSVILAVLSGGGIVLMLVTLRRFAREWVRQRTEI
ncbi:MAG: hypothetical protein FWG87_11830 [Defluviitaleaceae bacterium]|nr:hypothetical protein [Defluviitaleaceae bacterium]